VICEQLHSLGVCHQALATQEHAGYAAEQVMALLDHARSAGDPFSVVILDEECVANGAWTLVEEVHSNAQLTLPRVILLTGASRNKQRPLPAFAERLAKPVRVSRLAKALSFAPAASATPRDSTVEDAGMPLTAAPPTTPAILEPEATESPVTENTPCRILVAEDNVVNQKLAVGLLRKQGCEVEIAENGREAIDKLQDQQIDVVFMDCHMPVMDGFEATAEIRRLDAAIGRHTPIIALTASAMQLDRDRCLAAGMDDYLSKPVSADDLRLKIEQWRLCPSNARCRRSLPGSHPRPPV
jgi:CheY-like chemotaxis protein